jgi:hypothetical protein
MHGVLDVVIIVRARQPGADQVDRRPLGRAALFAA